MAAVVMGILVLVIGLPVVTTVLVWDPAEIGLEPDAGAADTASLPLLPLLALLVVGGSAFAATRRGASRGGASRPSGD